MAHEEYIESVIIRDDNRPHTPITMFDDVDVDAVFEFEGTIKLMQIIKSVQNAVHNRHQYVLKIENITKLQKEGT